MSETHGCDGDAAAYALGALDPSDAAEFRRHLDSCAVCRDELAAFEHVVDALPASAPRLPVPKALRRRVMREVHAERGRAPRHDQPRRRHVFSGPFVPRLAIAGATLAVLALAAVGGIDLVPGGSSGARVIQASVTGSAARAQLRVSGGRAELVVSHLPAPPPGRIYELWVQHGSRAPSPTRALFSVTSSGAADVGVPGSVRGVSAILVTQEPAGGTLVPTHAPVIVARLT
ncbi:MAG: anti-sigma factor [Solirubrobacteraceae bacterium]